MNSSVTRTLLFEFCPDTVEYAAESQSVLYSAIFSAVYPWRASWITRSM